MLKNFSPEEERALRDWGDSQSLEPPPFPASFVECRSLLPGLQRYDPLFCSLSFDELVGLMKNPSSAPASHFCTPAWLDRTSVSRGQNLFIQNCSSMMLAYTAALLHGFTLGRFSEVLVLSGYAKSHWDTYYRFRQTWLYIFTWSAYSIDSVEFRSAITRVRAMHEMARRSVKSKWAKGCEEGKVGHPLSQYDMGLVLMAFSGLALSVSEKECELKWSKRDIQDFVSLWRLIGFWIGIEDEFNVCVTPEKASAVFVQVESLTEFFMRKPRDSSVELARSSIEGFGKFTPVSRDHYIGLMFCSSDRQLVPWMGEGMDPKPESVKRARDMLRQKRNTFVYYFSLFCLYFSRIALLLDLHVVWRLPKLDQYL